MYLIYADTETFSPQDLSRVGAARYAEDAQIILWSYAENDAPAKVWDRVSSPQMPADLKRMWERLFADPDARVVMHNGMNFDRQVFASNGFGEIPAEKIIDTMVLAYEHALPGSLEQLCEAFRLDADHAKDKDGKRLIQIFCKPLPVNYKLTRATPQTHPAEWERFKNYARLDIEAMRAIYKKLPKWNATAQERRLQALDAVINSRGMCIDLELAKGAVETAARHRTHLAARTRELTGGAVSAATQRDALLEYLRAEWGLDLVSATRAEVEKRIAEPGIPEPVKDLLRVRIASTKISVQKFQSVLNAACEDGRLRGCLQFRGASRTGRFSGRIFQPQNLARPTMRNDEIEFAIEATKGGLLDTFYEDPMPVLSNLLRGLIIAPKGKKLVVADYSNVEGRVLAWLAGEEWKLKAFRDFDAGVGHDLYKLTYARAFNVKPETVTKAQRQMGKVLELGMGYGGGAGAFRTFALAYGIDLHDMADAVKSSISPSIWAEACEWYPKALLGGFTEGMGKEVFLACDSVKRAWRKANAQIVQFWYDMDAGVRQAVIEGGPVRVGRHITVDKKGNYLRVRLPSGRYLVYPSPRIDDDGISYFGVAQVSRKWARIRSWGGKYCIAKGTPVLTQEGWRPIEAITAADKVWDGVAWVQQSGVVCNGQKFCIKAYGVWMTPDHKVLTTEGWKDAKDHSRFNRVPCRLPDSVALCWDGRKESAVGDPLHLRAAQSSSGDGTYEDGKTRDYRILRMQTGGDHRAEESNTRHEQTPRFRGVALDETALRGSQAPGIQKLRRPGDNSLPGVGALFQGVLGGHGGYLEKGVGPRPYQQRRGVQPGELSVGNTKSELQQSPANKEGRWKAANAVVSRNRNRVNHAVLPLGARCSEGTAVCQAGRVETVYDLTNCGPRNRFVVLGEEGPVIVHNCENVTQAAACDLLCEALLNLEAEGYQTVLTVHDEAICEVPDTAAFSAERMEKIMCRLPKWAAGLPLAAAGFESLRYRKD
ncbi:DNA polymerase [Sutterella wadsworthensis]|uniref:DNA polymerase n=2 Tax=Sutterella wadsworthensis TaxID=40545 RepID=UPI00242E2E4B|nr:DNA polymerase [Sutterella wadsworthensis]